MLSTVHAMRDRGAHPSLYGEGTTITFTNKPAASAVDHYAARVDAVLAQRTRLRGPQPPGDLFAGLPASHPLLTADPHRPLGPNQEVIAAYLAAEDVLVDVGGGAGRISLPL